MCRFFIPFGVRDTRSVIALGKLFRTTAFKLSLVYLVIFAIGALLAMAYVGRNVKQLMDEQMAETVSADITGLSEQYAQGGLRQLVEVVERRTRQPGAGLYLVTTFAGETITGNVATLPTGVLQKPGLIETPYERIGEEKAHRRALARIFLLPGGFRLLVGHDVEDREVLRHILGRALTTSVVWLIVIGTLGGLLVARRVLRRVDGMNATAQTIMSGDLSGRLAVNGSGDELDRLAQNLNAMLDRIGELLNGMKEVTDNIAHDLKTPLTRVRNSAEQALLMAKSDDDYRNALEKVIDDSDGLIRIFNALLMIARAEAGSGREGMVDFDSADVARDIGELYEPSAEEKDQKFEILVENDLVLHGNRELIGQAIANLVDNALKYGTMSTASPDSQNAISTEKGPDVVLSARRIGEQIEIAIADRGPGIAPADRARVIDRFVRLENSRSRPGSGLGLSLAAAVARLHGGSLRIEDNEPGLRVVLALPARPASVNAQAGPGVVG